jgi:toxin ParE1/3/4
MPNPYKISYYSTATEDIINILNYISTENPTAAIKLIDKIDESIKMLADFPFMGTTPNDTYLRNKKYRLLIIDNYIVFYIPTDETKEVEIIRVLSSKQNYMSFL